MISEIRATPTSPPLPHSYPTNSLQLFDDSFKGRCGSCYSFAATGALEAAWKKKTGRLVSMSEQQIVDCAVGKRYHNKGCHGGWYQFAWKYLKENGKKNSFMKSSKFCDEKMLLH